MKKPGYSTTDFEFTAFLLAAQTPPVVLCTCVPVNERSKWGNKRSSMYSFVLIPDSSVVSEANYEEWKEHIANTAMRYVNGQTTVEPTALAMHRRTLRALLLSNCEVRTRGISLNEDVEIMEDRQFNR